MKYIKKCSQSSEKHLCDGKLALRRIPNKVLKDKKDSGRQIKKENSTGGEDCRCLIKNFNKWLYIQEAKSKENWTLRLFMGRNDEI